MLYLSGCVRDSLPPEMGVMLTPMMGNRLPEERTWAADTGCFAAPEKFDPIAYLGFLVERQYASGRCLFATMPDVVGDAKGTLKKVGKWPKVLRALGYKPALVAQDDLEALTVPWDDCDALFIGGTTKWKLGEHATRLIESAKERGKWVHTGRVNSYSRLEIVKRQGADSVDGTFIAFGPDINAPKMAHWVRLIREQQVMPLEGVI